MRWAADHIEAVHVNVRTPVESGRPVGMEPFGKRILTGNILKEMAGKVATVQVLEEDRKWCRETIGFVLLKD